MAKLNYYVELESGNPNLKQIINPKNQRGYETRADFAKDYGRYVYVNGVNFKMLQVRAEAKKKNTVFEIILSIIITAILLYYTQSPDYVISKWSQIMAIGLAWVVGFLIGALRISFQKADADFFNKS